MFGTSSSLKKKKKKKRGGRRKGKRWKRGEEEKGWKGFVRNEREKENERWQKRGKEGEGEERRERERGTENGENGARGVLPSPDAFPSAKLGNNITPIKGRLGKTQLPQAEVQRNRSRIFRWSQAKTFEPRSFIPRKLDLHTMRGKISKI